MNLVKLITDQLSGDTMGKLSSLLGADRSTTACATSAAIPSLLAGILGMASSDDGARKLSSTLNSLEPGGAGEFMRSLRADTGLVAQKGNGLLGSLFGSATRSGLVENISRFSGLGTGATHDLLSFLVPMVLAKVGAVWKGMGGGISALTSLFADQKQNIASALPSGFSLGNIPGLSSIASAVGSVGGAVESVTSVDDGSKRKTAAMSMRRPAGMGWLAATAAALIFGVLLFNLRRPADPMRSQTMTLPSVEEVTTGFRGALNSLGDTFTNIKDAASANEATPHLKEVNSQLDGLQALFNGLSESSRSTLRSSIGGQLDSLKDRASEMLKFPGLNAECRATLEQIRRKLSHWGVSTPDAPC
jgi:hypothetical protein